MNINQFEKETQNTKNIMISKIPNMCGNYSIQFFDNNKKHWKTFVFKKYADALTYVYMVGFIVVQHETMKKIILERGI